MPSLRIFVQEKFFGIKNIADSYNQNNEYQYESVVQLFATDYMHVGFYHCVKKSAEFSGDTSQKLEALVNTGEASKIYLFVEGKFLEFIHSPRGCFFSKSQNLIRLGRILLQIIKIHLFRSLILFKHICTRIFGYLVSQHPRTFTQKYLKVTMR